MGRRQYRSLEDKREGGQEVGRKRRMTAISLLSFVVVVVVEKGD